MIALAHPAMGDAERAAVLDVLGSGRLIQGPRVKALEARFAEACGATHAVATSSGTAALHVALLAHGVGPGDEVVTSPFSFVATANAILYTGARPVFADIDDATLLVDPARIEAAITGRTRAIVPVHLFGRACDLGALRGVAARHGVALIEDAAQAAGASFRGTPVGASGTAIFSLYATKNATAGEGGIVATDDAEVARRCRLLRNQGASAPNEHELLGFNYRMTEIAAAIGVAQMDRLAGFVARRRANAAFYDRELRGVRLPPLDDGCSWNQYTVRVAPPAGASPVAYRRELLAHLAARGVEARAYYPRPLPRVAHIAARGCGGDVPNASRAADEVLSIPVHPGLTDADRAAVVRAIHDFVGSA